MGFYVDGGSFSLARSAEFSNGELSQIQICRSLLSIQAAPKSSKMGHFCTCSNKLSLLSFQNGAWKCVVKGSPENLILWSDQLRVLRKLHGLERCGPLSPQ